MEIILCFRPIKWMFIRNWYSMYRWNNSTHYENRVHKLIDFGFITFGYSKPLKG
jgi:hypothetical protein